MSPVYQFRRSDEVHTKHIFYERTKVFRWAKNMMLMHKAVRGIVLPMLGAEKIGLDVKREDNEP